MLGLARQEGRRKGAYFNHTARGACATGGSRAAAWEISCHRRWGCSLVPGVGDARMALPALGRPPPPGAEIREGEREREGDGEMNLGGEQVIG